ncbi:hypothetical protein NKG94_11130 [Micromonospora sp. M12]
MAGDDYAAALSGLEAADDVTLVSLANESAVGNPAGAGAPRAARAQGARGDDVRGRPAADRLRHGQPGHREGPNLRRGHHHHREPAQEQHQPDGDDRCPGADGDAATAAMAAVAGLPVHHSIVLKKIRGVAIPVASSTARPRSRDSPRRT